MRKAVYPHDEFALAPDGGVPLETLLATFQGHPLLVGQCRVLTSGFGASVWAWGSTEFTKLRTLLHRQGIPRASSGWHQQGYALNFPNPDALARFLRCYPGESWAPQYSLSH
jgi:hypothetical protein